jgi:hypothetical protein
VANEQLVLPLILKCFAHHAFAFAVLKLPNIIRAIVAQTDIAFMEVPPSFFVPNLMHSTLYVQVWDPTKLARH